MPPEERFVPRFAAEPPQEGPATGRWADTLGSEAQNRAEAIAGQITQAAKQLNIELES